MLVSALGIGDRLTCDRLKHHPIFFHQGATTGNSVEKLDGEIGIIVWRWVNHRNAISLAAELPKGLSVPQVIASDARHTGNQRIQAAS